MKPGVLLRYTPGGMSVTVEGREHEFYAIYGIEMGSGIEQALTLTAFVSGLADPTAAAVEYVQLAALLGFPDKISSLRQGGAGSKYEHVMLMPGHHRWPNWEVEAREEIENVGTHIAWSRYYLNVRLPSPQNAVTATEAFMDLCEYLEVSRHITQMGTA